jgi:nitrous oxide reductase
VESESCKFYKDKSLNLIEKNSEKDKIINKKNEKKILKDEKIEKIEKIKKIKNIDELKKNPKWESINENEVISSTVEKKENENQNENEKENEECAKIRIIHRSISYRSGEIVAADIIVNVKFLT